MSASKPRVRVASKPLDATHLRQYRRHYVVISLLIITLSAAAVWLTLKAIIVVVTPPQDASTTTTSKPSEPSNTLRFVAMGDMLGHDSVVSQAKSDTGYDFGAYFKNIRPLYRQSDVVFCNQEGLVSGEKFGLSGYPAFNSPSEFAEGLSDGAGCNLINMANNHIGDKGQAAMDATIDVWAAHKPLAMAGANKTPEDQKKVAYFTKNGVKVAFVAFADFSNNTSVSDFALNIYHDTDLVEELMAEARSNADVVIVSAHWGTEDVGVVNTDQQKAAQLFADLGADVVIGTGPHVLQKTGYVDGQNGHKTLVWYSLGNMLSSQLEVDQLTGGIAGFTVTKSASGVKVTDLTFQPTFMSYDWSAADRAAENLLTRTNLRLQPLRSADMQIQRMFTGASLKERTAYVQRAIGGDADVTITP